MYIGSRNLDLSRVVGFHVPTNRVTETYFLSFEPELLVDDVDGEWFSGPG